MAEDRQRPGESDRDYLRRMAQAADRKKRLARDEMVQDALDAQAQAARTRKLNQGADEDLDDFLKDFSGGAGLEDFRKAAQQGAFDDMPEVQKALGDIKKAQGAMFGSKEKTRKAIKKNKGALKKGGKKAKGGCAVIAVALLGVGGGAAYGLFEAGHALISAMGR